MRRSGLRRTVVPVVRKVRRWSAAVSSGFLDDKVRRPRARLPSNTAGSRDAECRSMVLCSTTTSRGAVATDGATLPELSIAPLPTPHSHFSFY